MEVYVVVTVWSIVAWCGTSGMLVRDDIGGRIRGE